MTQLLPHRHSTLRKWLPPAAKLSKNSANNLAGLQCAIQTMDTVRMEVGLNPNSRSKYDSTFADYFAVCNYSGIRPRPVSYLSLGVYLTFKAGVNDSAKSLPAYCTHIKRGLMDYYFDTWFNPRSVAWTWIMQLRRGLQILYFKEVNQSKPFRQSIIIDISNLDFTQFGFHSNVRTTLLAFLDQCHDGTHRAGELLNDKALRSDYVHVGKHLAFEFNELNRPKAHKTSFCPAVVLHNKTRAHSSLTKYWAAQSTTKHAFCHVRDDGTFVPGRHLSKSTVERWLKPIFEFLKIEDVTLHGCRAAGLIYQIMRGVNPLLSALQGHWSLSSQSQFAYSRMSPAERLQYYDELKGFFS